MEVGLAMQVRECHHQNFMKGQPAREPASRRTVTRDGNLFGRVRTTYMADVIELVWKEFS